MAVSDDTTSYKSPYYDGLDARAEKEFGIPSGLQAAIRKRGERSNADQVSEAGAATVYQIIPATRDAALKKWGVDAYVSPEAAAEVAARLLKDSLDRNKGDVAAAVAEYHGGTNRENWGPKTKDYVRRVTGSTLDRVTNERAAAAAAAPNIAKVYAAYKSGAMTPEERAEFEGDIAAGRVLLPRGARIAVSPTPADERPRDAPPAPPGVLRAYSQGVMTPEERAEFEADARAGRIKVPDGVIAAPKGVLETVAGILGAVAEPVTGSKRATIDTDTMPDWVGMPELSTFTRGSALASVGTLFAGPDEAVKIIKKQFPDTKARKDEKGNWILKSSIDGQEYAIKPGFTWGDIPRAISAIAAFMPAGYATSIAGGAAASAATQGAIEATQAGTGGEFNPADVGVAAAGGALVPAVARGVAALRGGGPPTPAATVVDAVTPPGAMQQAEARAAAGVGGPIPPAAPSPAATVAQAVPEAPPIVHEGRVTPTPETIRADAENAANVWFKAGYSSMLAKPYYAQRDGGIKKTMFREVTPAALDLETRVFVDPKGQYFIGSGSKENPLQTATVENLQKAREKTAKALETARTEMERVHWGAFTQQANDLAAEAQAAGLKVRHVSPEDSNSQYLYITGPDKKELKVRFADHPQPRDYKPDGTYGPVGGFSEKIGARHAASDVSIAPGEQTLDDARKSIRALTTLKAPPAAPSPAATVAQAVPEAPPVVSRPVETVPATPTPAAPVAPELTVPPAATPAMTAEELARTTRTAAGGGFGSKKATQAVADQTMPNPETIASAKRLGIAEHLQPDHVTTNQAYRELAQAVKSVPGSETRAAEMEGLAKVAERADGIITELGGTRDLSAVSANVRARLQAEYDALKRAARSIYADIDKAIKPTTPAPATDVLALVQRRADEMGGLKNLSGAERDLAAKLTPVKGREPTYALLDQMRKDIGAAKRDTDNVFRTADGKLLGELEDALRIDQGRIAQAAGVGAQWDAARSTVRMYKGIQDDLTALFGKELSGSIVGDLTSATTALAKGDNSRLVGLLKAVPADMRQEVVASGLASAFGHQSRSGGISFPGYVKWFEGLERNSQARNALFSNLPPEAVTRLRDLYNVSKGIAESTRERITTGRIMAAPIAEIINNADSLMGRLFDLARRSAGGIAAEAVTAPLGIPGAGIAAGIASALARGKPNAMKAADALISSPEFKAAIKNGTKTSINRLAQSGRFTAFVRAVGNPREMTSREKWIAQSLQTKEKK